MAGQEGSTGQIHWTSPYRVGVGLQHEQRSAVLKVRVQWVMLGMMSPPEKKVLSLLCPRCSSSGVEQ